MKAAFIIPALVVCLCLVAVPPPARAQTDCYFSEDTGTNTLVLGNSKVELRFCKEYGVLLDLVNVETGTDFIHDEAGKRPGSWFLRYREVTSKWAAGAQRDGPLVKGWEKALTSWQTEIGSDNIRLSLVHEFPLGNGMCTVTQIVRVIDGSPFTRWRLIIDNPAATERTITIATHPHFRGINVIGGDDYFITPQRRGERWENFDFYRPESGKHIREAQYPLAAWQWLWYGNPREGLYLASWDPDAMPKDFRYGYDDRDFGMDGQANRDEEMSIMHYPFLQPGSQWYSPLAEVGLKDGPGWYWGADRYREWMEKDPPEGPGWRRAYPEWAKEAHSFIWSQIDLYSNYPSLLQNVWEQRGNHILMDGAWWDSYGDEVPGKNWPRFEVNQSQGGLSGLSQGMAGCGSQGDRVLFFTIISLADQQGAWYYQNPDESVMELYRDQYGEWLQRKKERKFSYIDRWFYDQSFWSTNLRDTVIADHTAFKNAGVDAAWLDCIAVFGERFCYNRDVNPGRSTPADALGPGLTGFLGRLNDEVWRRPGEGTDRLIAIEGIHDFLVPYVDYWGMYHMVGYQGSYSGEHDYPEVARYLLPGVFGNLHRNDEDHDGTWSQASFTFGCKLGGPEEATNLWQYYDAYEAAPGSFYHGTFKADLGLTASGAGNLKAFSFVSSGGNTVVVTIWNRDSSQRAINVQLDLSAMGISGSVEDAFDLWTPPRHLDWKGGSSFTASVPADSVTAVKLRLVLGPTPTPTLTPPPTATPSPTLTPVPSKTPTPQPTATRTPTPTITLTPTITPTPTATPHEARKLAMMKREGENDLNLYYYNCPSIGDMKYSDALRSNPAALARDLWMIPRGNEAIGMSAIEATGDTEDELLVLAKEGESDINLYLFNSLVPGDWTYWDAEARNPSPLARDLWIVPSGNDTAGITAIDIDGGREEVAVLRRDGGGDINLYIYNSPAPGDWTYWDAIARNPSAIARDFWSVPSGNDAIGLAALDVNGDGRKELAILKREGQNDVNLYLYNAPRPGDWTYWDALARNPTPVSRDLWIIPAGNDFNGMTAVDMDLSALDELAVLKLENGTDMNLYLYNSPLPGDWTYWDVAARNPAPLARDLWLIPSGNSAAGLTAVRLE